MPTKAEDESGLMPVEDDNVDRREIYRKTLLFQGHLTIRKNSMIIDREYVDEYYMGKILSQ